MGLSPEQRIRAIGWGAAMALHLCAGVLILRAASWGDAQTRPFAPDRSGVILLTLTRAPAAAQAASSRGPEPAAVVKASLPSPQSSPIPQPPAAASGGSSARTEPSAAATPSPGAPPSPSEIDGADADRFRQALLAQIARYKQYPPEAVRERIQGTVWVHFMIDREGRLLGVWVDQSSGHRMLDEEAMAAVRRAAPFPAIPSGLPDKIDLTLGIPFSVG